MSFVLLPWQLLVIIVSAWMTKAQQELIEYVITENQVLKEKLGGKRMLLNDDQRRRLAVKGKILARKRLQEMGTLFTPDTILRWYRQLVIEEWDYSRRRKSPGRPRTGKEIVDLVIQMARENPSWGYDRIQGALANLGHNLSDQTVGNILKDHGIQPAPIRRILVGHDISDHGSGYEIHRRLSQTPQRVGCESHSSATAITQNVCSSGTLHEIDQERSALEDDILWREFTQEGHDLL